MQETTNVYYFLFSKIYPADADEEELATGIQSAMQWQVKNGTQFHQKMVSYLGCMDHHVHLGDSFE